MKTYNYEYKEIYYMTNAEKEIAIKKVEQLYNKGWKEHMMHHCDDDNEYGTYYLIRRK